ncbi:MAG TPA: GGDEF domain-containing protein [Stellaceae bacterium]|nr:GGDEF domain-containing protein [Stellaceae bacterium]
MEIRERKSVKGVSAARPAAAPQVTAAPVAVPAARDVAEVAGIPEAELTPNVRRALTALMAEVEQLRRQLADTNSRIGYLEKLVDEDPLMPVVNRRAFVRELSRMMAFSQRYGVPASIVYFDINDMKQVNDRFGHAAGDAVLFGVAKALLENVRTTDVVGRLGGDEMGVLLVQTDEALAEHKAAELAAKIQAMQIPWEGGPIGVGVAYGVRAFGTEDSAGAVIDAADRAMYQSKNRMKAAK